MAPPLLLGTLNVIGENHNPWQFEAPAADRAARVPGGAATWARALARANAAFDAYDVAAALEALDNAVATAASSSPDGGARAAALAALVHGWCDDRALDDAASLAALASDGTLDLALDNRWMPHEGRLNPIVFGLASMPPAPPGSGADAETTTTQLVEARRDPAQFVARVVDAHGARFVGDDAEATTAALGAHGGAATGAAASVAQRASLVLWDLLCACAYASAADAFDVLARASSLTATSTVRADDDGDDASSAPPEEGEGFSARFGGVGAVELRPWRERLDAILRPAFYAAAAHPDAPLVVGCQEMPSAPDDLAALVALAGAPPPCVGALRHGDKLGGGAKLPPPLRVAPPSTAGASECGFLYRNLEYDDATTRAAPALARCLDEAEARVAAKSIRGAARVPDDVKATTLRKLTVGVFRSSARPPPIAEFAVVNLHCKSFGDNTRAQAEFVAAAPAAVAAALSPPSSSSTPQPSSLAVFVVGDMNIVCSFAKGLDAAAQARAVSDAPLGRLPAAAQMNRGALDAFCGVLAAAGAVFEPPPDSLTTLKRRTRFQAQPEKAGELTIAHKDFVVLPPPPAAATLGSTGACRAPEPPPEAATPTGCHPPPPWGSLRVRSVALGGIDDDGGETAAFGDSALPMGAARVAATHLASPSAPPRGNMDLLQPSVRWPGDHSSVLCLIDGMT